MMMRVLRFIKRRFITLTILGFCSFLLIKSGEKAFDAVFFIFLFCNAINMARLNYKKGKKSKKKCDHDHVFPDHYRVGSSSWMMRHGSDAYKNF